MNEWDAKLLRVAKELKKVLAERGMAPQESEPMDCDEVEFASSILKVGMDFNEGNLTYGEYCTGLYDVGNPTEAEHTDIVEALNKEVQE